MDPTQIPLRDLHLPDAIGWWPLAPGWWIVIAVLAITALALLRKWLQRRSRALIRSSVRESRPPCFGRSGYCNRSCPRASRRICAISRASERASRRGFVRS